jgi:hypothetical protein
MRRKLAHGGSHTARGRDGFIDIRFSGLGDLGDEFSGERINDRGQTLA